MRRIGILLVLAFTASAEPDAAVAHPLRWCDPNGTPAGTRSSRCLPLTDEVVEAWNVKLPGPAASPLVYWEREAYVTCHDKDRSRLVAIDAMRGKIVANKRLPKGSAPTPVQSKFAPMNAPLSNRS